MAKHAVDLDGTLAEQYWKKYDEDYDPGKIGNPISLMVDRVKYWLSIGDEVVIYTCRVNPTDPAFLAPFVEAFEKWSMEVFGKVLCVTAMKDPYVDDFWDDKAVRVVRNTGMISNGSDVKDPLDKSDQMGKLM